MSGFYDTASNFHPFECDGPGKCIHHDREMGVTHLPEHDEGTCRICDWNRDKAAGHVSEGEGG